MTRASGTSLRMRAWVSSARVAVLQAAALFLAAGTLAYWQAWAFLSFQLATTVATNQYLLRKDPALLQRRLAFEERAETQAVHRLFFALLRPLALALLVIAGLDHRFGWSAVPLPVVAASYLVLAAGALVVFSVLDANSHASSLIEVTPHQKVISTGPYRWVRHPMYAGFLLSLAATPLSLGSYRAGLLFLPVCALLVLRLLAEEKFLAAELPGYTSYLKTTPKRLIPWLW